MNLSSSNLSKWWPKIRPDAKTVLRGVVHLVAGLQKGDMLSVMFTGSSFVPSLVLFNPSAAKPIPKQSDDAWWASISAEEQNLTLEIAKLLKELQPFQNELHIIRTSVKLHMDLVPRFNPPAWGKPMTN